MPKMGHFYKTPDGSLYLVLMLATHDDGSGDTTVVYRSAHGPKPWTLPLQDFTERFSPC